ncbi:putative reverse transcriptase domain-containing protein [Tanacetum coccineum]
MSTIRQGITSDAIEQLIAQRVAATMTAHEANRVNGNGSQNETSRGTGGTVHTTRGCTYKEFLNFQPRNFKGTKGAVGLARWFEKIEYLNSHVKTVGIDTAYEMSWKELMKMMTEVYFPRNELALLFPGMVLDEEKKIEGFANGLMDQKVRANAARQAENKRRWESNQGNNHVQQPPPKRQNVARAYTARPREKKVYAGTLPFCNKYKLHHTGSCTVKCGYYRSECLKLKNQNHGNKVGNGEAWERAYALGGGEANQEPNIVAGMFLLNNRYASILFDTGAERSFVSTTFSPLIDIVPTALDTKYTIELADGKLIRTDSIILGYTLNFLNHLFNINLMLVELGSFDVIIGKEWLMKYHAVIICDEKIVRIPFDNEILMIQGEAN